MVQSSFKTTKSVVLVRKCVDAYRWSGPGVKVWNNRYAGNAVTRARHAKNAKGCSVCVGGGAWLRVWSGRSIGSLVSGVVSVRNASLAASAAGDGCGWGQAPPHYLSRRNVTGVGMLMLTHSSCSTSDESTQGSELCQKSEALPMD